MPTPTQNPRPPSWWRILGFCLIVATVGVAIDAIFDVHIAAWLVTLAVIFQMVWRRRPTDNPPEDPKE